LERRKGTGKTFSYLASGGREKEKGKGGAANSNPPLRRRRKREKHRKGEAFALSQICHKRGEEKRGRRGDFFPSLILPGHERRVRSPAEKREEIAVITILI